MAFVAIGGAQRGLRFFHAALVVAEGFFAARVIGRCGRFLCAMLCRFFHQHGRGTGGFDGLGFYFWGELLDCRRFME